jgi:hypothetical protein
MGNKLAGLMGGMIETITAHSLSTFPILPHWSGFNNDTIVSYEKLMHGVK